MPPKSRLRSLSTVMRKDTLPPHMHSDVQKNASHIDSSLLASHVQFEAPKRQKGREGISPYEPIGNSKIQAHGNSSESQVSKVVNLTSTTQEKLASTIQSGVQNDGFNMDRTVSASGAHFNGSHVRIQAPRLQLHRKSSRTQVSKIANHGSISQDRFLSGDENNASHVHSTSSKYQVQGNSSRMQVSKSAPQGPLLGNSSNTRVSKTSTVGVTNFMGDGNNASHVHTTSAKYQVQGKSSRMQVSVSAPQGPLLGNSSNTQVSKTSTVGVTNFMGDGNNASHVHTTSAKYQVQGKSSRMQVSVSAPQEDNPHVPIQSNNSLEETTIGVADVPMKRRCAQRQRVLMAAITRANDFLDSTPADSNRDADRQVHISNEVLEAYYAEINGNDSSHVATSNAPISTVRKTRGPTQETTVLPPKGERWKCLVNDQQPVGKAASKLAIVLGLYARMEGYFPPHKEWNAGSLHSFNDVMKDIMRDYDFVDHEGMPANMMEVIRFCKASLQKKLRDWRCWLKSRYYVEGVPDEVLMKAPDKRVSQVNWEALLKLWETDKKVLEAERNKKNRGEDRATHTLGSKSIARHNQDLREQLREEYTTLGAYIKAHQTKTGEYPDEYTRVMCEKVIATCMERDIVNSSQPSVLSPILDIVYKRHHGGYERGRGLGWCRTLPLTNMEIQTSNENVKHLTNELEKAKSEIEAMHAREREMEVREREREAREREREAQQLKEKEEMLSREREMQERLQKMEAIISMKFRSV